MNFGREAKASRSEKCYAFFQLDDKVAECNKIGGFASESNLDA